MQIKRTCKKGFTLAEILVTLAIIGVVAALTIPSLMQNIQNQQLKTAFKKTYSDLNAATLLIINDNGGNLTNAFPDWPYSGTVSMINRYNSYLSFVKVCNGPSINADCWHKNTDYTGLNGDLNSAMPSGYRTLAGGSIAGILSNGSLIAFTGWNNNESCTATYCCPQMIQECGRIIVDVNGFKEPNIIGKDIFYVHITATGLKPYGVDSEPNVYSNCQKGNWGLGCASKVLLGIDY